MSKRAEALKHKHYSNGPELSGVAGWSNNRRFIHPGDIWAAQDKTWYHDDPVARPPREGSDREAFASENRMLLQNPMYQFMHDRISQIGHAFTAAEMSALRDKLDPDTSATIMQAMRLHAKGSRTQASMDPTVSVALSNSSIPEELKHMRHVLRKRGSDAVNRERNASRNITSQAYDEYRRGLC